MVDDDDIYREVNEEVINKLGHFVLAAESGEAALAVIKSNRPDMIVSDYNMGGMNGYELYRETQRLFGKIPFLIITGNVVEFSRLRELGLDVMLKPYRISKLQEKINVILKGQEGG